MRINGIQGSKHNNFLFQRVSYYKIAIRMCASIKPHLNYDIPLLLKGAMNSQRKTTDNKEIEKKMLWNMKVTYNK